MRRLLSTTAVAFALLYAVTACGGSQTTGTESETTPPTGDDKTTPTTGEPTTPEPAKGDLGAAPDATVLAEDGSHVQLASAWLNTNAVLIFLRGHW